jgi:hypothetical protein
VHAGPLAGVSPDGDAVSARCDAWRDEWPTVHTCGDPLACALDRLIEEDDPRDEELNRLRTALDEVRDLIDGKKTRLALDIRRAVD